MMLISGELMEESTAYNVVVLPLPVGPVIKIIPLGDATSFFNLSSISASNPRSLSLISELVLFSNRMTTLSPNDVGIVDTRTSISWFPIFRFMRPSCGSRFSAIFILAITLILEMREA